MATNECNGTDSARPPTNSPPVVGDAQLTHGTLEERQLAPSRLLYEKLLGLRCVQHSPQSQLIGGKSGVGVVAVQTGSAVHEQSSENRWVILAGNRTAVLDIHRRATMQATAFAIATLTEVTQEQGASRFLLQDADGNWWEISSRSPRDYQMLFARGDIAAFDDTDTSR